MNYFLLSIMSCILVNILCIVKLWVLVPIDDDGSVNLTRGFSENLRIFLKRWGLMVMINLIGVGILVISYFYKIPILPSIDCLIIIVFSTIMYVFYVTDEVRYYSILT